MKELNLLLQKLDLTSFDNLELLQEAFTHRSFSKSHNERLEFLGDAVLELVITECLFRDFPEKLEGELTSFRAAIVRSESLAAEALRLSLGDFILMSKGEESTGGRTRLYILADIFESLIGAIYLEKGYEVTKTFILKNLYYKIQDIVAQRLDIDAKSKLQELAQDQFKSTPHYKLVREEGPDHDKTFTVVAVICDKEYGEGSGKSKQVAEQNAAMQTLELIQGKK